MHISTHCSLDKKNEEVKEDEDDVVYVVTHPVIYTDYYPQEVNAGYYSGANPNYQQRYISQPNYQYSSGQQTAASQSSVPVKPNKRR